MAGAHRLQRVYRATAIFWLTTTLLVVAANLLAVGGLSWRGAEEPGTGVDTAPLAQAYPKRSRSFVSARAMAASCTHYAPRLQRMLADCIVDAVRQGGFFR